MRGGDAPGAKEVKLRLQLALIGEAELGALLDDFVIADLRDADLATFISSRLSCHPIKRHRWVALPRSAQRPGLVPPLGSQREGAHNAPSTECGCGPHPVVDRLSRELHPARSARINSSGPR
jgi:hypothetical protein